MISARSANAVARHEESIGGETKAEIDDSYSAGDPPSRIEIRAHPCRDEVPPALAAVPSAQCALKYFSSAFNDARREAVHRLWDAVFICHKLFSEPMSFCIAIGESGSYGLCTAESRTGKAPG